MNLAVACGANPDPFRPIPGYGNITHLQPAASSIYHAFQMSVRRSLGGLTLSGAYTFSHSIDASPDGGDGSFLDSYNPSSNRASSNFDQRHILNVSYVWDLPFFKAKGVTHSVLGGWEYSGIVAFSTGSPFSPTFGTVSDNAGAANGVGSASRPDLIGDLNGGFTPVPAAGLGKQFYSASIFAAPRGLTLGDAGRNILKDPAESISTWHCLSILPSRNDWALSSARKPSTSSTTRSGATSRATAVQPEVQAIIPSPATISDTSAPLTTHAFSNWERSSSSSSSVNKNVNPGLARGRVSFCNANAG